MSTWDNDVRAFVVALITTPGWASGGKDTVDLTKAAIVMADVVQKAREKRE